MISTDLQPPYYAAFKDPSVEAIKARVKALRIEYSKYKMFMHLRLSEKVGAELISLVPLNDKLSLKAGRVSLFITPPRTYYRAHKDGADLRFGVNYPIMINDAKAITRFYEDQDVESKYHVQASKHSREVINFNPFAVKPTCSFRMSNDDIVILNVEKYHDFHNTSDAHRVILTFRSADQSLGFSEVTDLFLHQ